MKLAIAQCSACFGPRLRALRTAREWSQPRLAAAAGVDASSIAAWERRRALPNFTALLGLADAFGITLDDLIRGTES